MSRPVLPLAGHRAELGFVASAAHLALHQALTHTAQVDAPGMKVE